MFFFSNKIVGVQIPTVKVLFHLCFSHPAAWQHFGGESSAHRNSRNLLLALYSYQRPACIVFLLPLGSSQDSYHQLHFIRENPEIREVKCSPKDIQPVDGREEQASLLAMTPPVTSCKGVAETDDAWISGLQSAVSSLLLVSKVIGNHPKG